MKDHKVIWSLAFCALLLLLLPCRIYAAGYGELTTDISFRFQNDSSVLHTCKAVIEPIDDAPVPEQSEAEAENGGEGRFVLLFSRPGIFQYRIYQTEKDISGVIYDDRVYTLTIAVRSGENGRLACSMWVSLDGEEKLDIIEFVNRDPKSGEEPGTSPDTRPSDAGAPEGTAEVTKTGDDNSLELYFAMMALSVLLLLSSAIAERYRRKAGDGI